MQIVRVSHGSEGEQQTFSWDPLNDVNVNDIIITYSAYNIVSLCAIIHNPNIVELDLLISWK